MPRTQQISSGIQRLVRLVRLTLLALPALALIAACDGAPTAATTESVADETLKLPERLHREGRWLVDNENRIVLLHGVNAVWKLAPYAPPATAEGFTAADADWLLAHGFNAVRLGTLFAGVMPQRGVIDAAYLQQIDRVLQLLAARGIWVLLDFHEDMYNERFQGEGFPAWAVYDDGVPLLLKLGFPGNLFEPATSIAYDNFWNNHAGLWDQYRAAWRAVAAKWAGQDHLMGYELINEPWPGTRYPLCLPPLGCPGFDEQQLQGLQDHARAGIREVDASNLVWFEPLVLLNYGAPTYLGAKQAVADSNLGFSWHLYCSLPALSQLHLNKLSCPILDTLVSGAAAKGATRLGAASLVTEFGATDDSTELVSTTTTFDAQLLGWMYWAYKNWHDPTTSGSGVQGLFADDANLGSVKTAKLDLLERAYPQATAGKPLALSFDPTSAVFSYRYAPRSAAAPTDIYLPALHYPHGYSVGVSGARVLAASTSTHLLLENLPGATEVDVEVRAQ